MKYFLSLGSNLGDKKSNLDNAIFFLKGIGKIITVSSIYKTSPVNMPVETEYFLNLVLELDTHYTPDKLLTTIKKFEKKKVEKKNITVMSQGLLILTFYWPIKLKLKKKDWSFRSQK